MAKAQTLKEKADRLKKKLAAGKEKIDPARARGLKKSVKRAQRRRRLILKAEEKLKAKAAAKAAGEKKEEGAPA